MELKVGQYVRDRKGRIRKIKTINTIRISTFQVRRTYIKRYGPRNVPDFRTLINGFIDEVDVTKSSNRPEDLIKVGDALRLLNTDSNAEILWLVENEELLRELIIYIRTGEMKLLGIITKEELNDVEYILEGE